jgi:hypothetical protein
MAQGRWTAGDETRTRDIQLGRHIHEFEFSFASGRRWSAFLQVLITGHVWTRLRQPGSCKRVEHVPRDHHEDPPLKGTGTTRLGTVDFYHLVI